MTDARPPLLFFSFVSEVLIVFGHPAPQKSVACKNVLGFLQESMPAAKVHSLFDVVKSPVLDENTIKQEQELLVSADSVVLLFPFQWYNVPGITKCWIDGVFSYGFAYGAEGDKLKGKNLLLATTVGGTEESYRHGGEKNFEVPEFLNNLQEMASFSQMNFLEPVIQYNMAYMPNVHNDLETISSQAKVMSDAIVGKLAK